MQKPGCSLDRRRKRSGVLRCLETTLAALISWESVGVLCFSC